MKRFKTLLAGLIAALILSSPCFACGNYTYSTIQTETYNSTSPIGTVTTYNGAMPVNNYYVQGYPTAYYPVPELPDNVYEAQAYQSNLIANQGGVYNSTTVTTPQAYDKQVVTTTSYVDQRDPIDRNIDRAGRVTGILGVAALFGVGIAALISAL